MTRGRLTTAIIAAICIPAFGLGLGLGLGLSGTASAAPASRTAPASFTAPASRTERMVAISCRGLPQVRPGSFTLACADGNDYLTRLSWTSWAPGLASATGFQEENDCIPFCAAGHFHRYPVDVIFWGGVPLRGTPGAHRYTTVTLLYPGARPNVYNGHRWVRGPATGTMPLPGPPN